MFNAASRGRKLRNKRSEEYRIGALKPEALRSVRKKNASLQTLKDQNANTVDDENTIDQISVSCPANSTGFLKKEISMRGKFFRDVFLVADRYKKFSEFFRKKIAARTIEAAKFFPVLTYAKESRAWRALLR